MRFAARALALTWGLSATVIAGSDGSAGSAAQRWIALSTTARAITGEVAFSPGRLTFANGTSARIAFVRTLRAAHWAGGDTSGAAIALYRLVRFANPPLLGGNKLCAERPSFLSIQRGPAFTQGTNGDVVVAVFSGVVRLRGDGRDHLCATYSYESVASKP